MYSRNFDPPSGTVPENYAGNAFASPDAPPIPREEPKPPDADSVPVSIHKAPATGAFFKMPDEDLLLILLAFLLSGGSGGEELPMMLLLLLAFQP